MTMSKIAAVILWSPLIVLGFAMGLMLLSFWFGVWQDSQTVGTLLAFYALPIGASLMTMPAIILWTILRSR